MSGSLVDWRLAAGVARRVGGAGDADVRARPFGLEPEALGATCAEAERLIRAYSLLDPESRLPVPEAVGRAEWSRGALSTLRGLADELQREHAVEINLPGPLGGIARSVVGAATGTEVGIAAGYAARRVLGQYDVTIAGPERPARLLFVAPNLTASAAQLEVDFDAFLRWVALHETTHAIQFAEAPWLRGHLGGLIRSLIAGATQGLGLSDLLRRLASNPRGTLSTLLRGDLAQAIAGPEQAPTLDRIQAAMTVIEGHAEHVMDAAAADFVPDVEVLRDRLSTRRASRGPLETIAARLLGLDLKLRQYELGKSFCDAVVADSGIATLNRVWSGPDAIPSTDELACPEAWLERIATSESVPWAATTP
ncbi:MAG: zinc-dependent metalloprotease [Solirubrobacterales bacterium]